MKDMVSMPRRPPRTARVDHVVYDPKWRSMCMDGLTTAPLKAYTTSATTSAITEYMRRATGTDMRT